MVKSLWPVNAVSGEPGYNGRALRQLGSVKYAGARAARPFGTRSGVRPGTPDGFVWATSVSWGVAPHAGVLDVHTPAAVGPYEYALDAEETGPLDAADASYPRVDLVYVQVADPSESDGTSTPGLVVGYTAGTPAAAPSAPTTPARAMVLATISVPRAGGGSPTVQRQAPTLTLAGAPYQVRSDAERDALLATLGSSVAAPLWVEHVGGSRAGVVERHRGSGWEVVTAGTIWSPYTPTLSNITLGNGTLSGAFCQIGRTVHYRASLVLGSSSSLTSLAIVGIPRQITTSAQLFGHGIITDASTSASQMIMARAWTGTTVGLYLAKDGAAVAPGSPWTWAAGDTLLWSGTYDGHLA
jgi:hypothetical protein